MLSEFVALLILCPKWNSSRYCQVWDAIWWLYIIIVTKRAKTYSILIAECVKCSKYSWRGKCWLRLTFEVVTPMIYSLSNILIALDDTNAWAEGKINFRVQRKIWIFKVQDHSHNVLSSRYFLYFKFLFMFDHLILRSSDIHLHL